MQNEERLHNLTPKGRFVSSQSMLVGNEKWEDYDNFFSAIVAAVNPSDAIAWLLAQQHLSETETEAVA
jgi:hypothetical protein